MRESKKSFAVASDVSVSAEAIERDDDAFIGLSSGGGELGCIVGSLCKGGVPCIHGTWSLERRVLDDDSVGEMKGCGCGGADGTNAEPTAVTDAARGGAAMAVVVDDALRLVGKGNGGDGGLVAVADEDDGDSDELAAKKGACDDVSVAYGAECTGRLGR